MKSIYLSFLLAFAFAIQPSFAEKTIHCNCSQKECSCEACQSGKCDCENCDCEDCDCKECQIKKD